MSDRYTPQMNGAKAPSAGRPGQGRGNVPFAPGVMSGNLGQQTNQAPLARQVGGARVMNPQKGPPGPAQPQSGGPGGAAPPPPGNGSIIDPMFYMKLLDDYMRALFDSAQKPFGGDIY
jgi:hypothetical protein